MSRSGNFFSYTSQFDISADEFETMRHDGVIDRITLGPHRVGECCAINRSDEDDMDGDVEGEMDEKAALIANLMSPALIAEITAIKTYSSQVEADVKTAAALLNPLHPQDEEYLASTKKFMADMEVAGEGVCSVTLAPRRGFKTYVLDLAQGQFSVVKPQVH